MRCAASADSLRLPDPQVPGAKLRPSQVQVKARMEAQGWQWRTITSVQEFRYVMQELTFLKPFVTAPAIPGLVGLAPAVLSAPPSYFGSSSNAKIEVSSDVEEVEVEAVDAGV